MMDSSEDICCGGRRSKAGKGYWKLVIRYWEEGEGASVAFGSVFRSVGKRREKELCAATILSLFF